MHIKEKFQDLCVCIYVYIVSLKIIEKPQNVWKCDKMELYTADRRVVHKMSAQTFLRPI